MYVLLLVIVFLLGFGLGGALLLLFIVAGAQEDKKAGKLAFAYYSDKKQRWEVYGNYLAIAGKIAARLKAAPDKHAPDVHYIE